MQEKYEPFLPAPDQRRRPVPRDPAGCSASWPSATATLAGGERLHERKTVPGGLLGADYEVADGRYRFKKIYGGAELDPELRSPLTAPGVNVKEGEYLLAVDGKELKAADRGVLALREHRRQADRDHRRPEAPTARARRTVTVEPIANELALRNMDWVEGNLRKVEKATGGRVGVRLRPRHGRPGAWPYFKRYFFPQVDKDALDHRRAVQQRRADRRLLHRHPPPAVRELLGAAPRGRHTASPSAAVFGPKVMIIDETAGSGGDMLPWMFRKFKLGPLVGKRTWGGLVGISGTPVLMDGGT